MCKCPQLTPTVVTWIVFFASVGMLFGIPYVFVVALWCQVLAVVAFVCAVVVACVVRCEVKERAAQKRLSKDHLDRQIRMQIAEIAGDMVAVERVEREGSTNSADRAAIRRMKGVSSLERQDVARVVASVPAVGSA